MNHAPLGLAANLLPEERGKLKVGFELLFFCSKASTTRSTKPGLSLVARELEEVLDSSLYGPPVFRRASG